MRSKVPLAFAPLLLILTTVPACASGIDDKAFDQQTIDALEAKAAPGAAPRPVLPLRRTRAPDDRVQRSPIRPGERGQGRHAAQADPARWPRRFTSPWPTTTSG